MNLLRGGEWRDNNGGFRRGSEEGLERKREKEQRDEEGDVAILCNTNMALLLIFLSFWVVDVSVLLSSRGLPDMGG